LQAPDGHLYQSQRYVPGFAGPSPFSFETNYRWAKWNCPLSSQSDLFAIVDNATERERNNLAWRCKPTRDIPHVTYTRRVRFSRLPRHCMTRTHKRNKRLAAELRKTWSSILILILEPGELNLESSARYRRNYLYIPPPRRSLALSTQSLFFLVSFHPPPA
jgi:hypothetical protein